MLGEREAAACSHAQIIVPEGANYLPGAGEHDDKLPGKGSTRKADEAIMAMRPT